MSYPPEIPGVTPSYQFPEHPEHHCYVTSSFFHALRRANVTGIIHDRTQLEAMSAEIQQETGTDGLPAPFNNLTFVYGDIRDPSVTEDNVTTVYSTVRKTQVIGIARTRKMHAADLILEEVQRQGKTLLEAYLDVGQLTDEEAPSMYSLDASDIQGMVVASVTRSMLGLPRLSAPPRRRWYESLMPQLPLHEQEPTDDALTAKEELLGRLVANYGDAIVLKVAEPIVFEHPPYTQEYLDKLAAEQAKREGGEDSEHPET